MKKLPILLLIIFLMSPFTSKAHAFYVVDTGVVPYDGILINGQYGVAMQFSIEQPYTITSIESMMNNWEDGIISLAIFNDDADFPNYTDELFRQNVFLNGPAVNLWQGATGLEFDLDAGTYWVTWDSFSNPFTFSMTGGAVNPLDHNGYLFVDPDIDPSAYFELTPHINLTLRVGADKHSNVVPEATTMMLLGGGLLGMLCRRKQLSRS